MSETPDLVEPKVVETIAAVDGVREVLDHEPGQEGLPLDSMPLVTMLYLGARVVSATTGNVEELEHTWDVFVYVQLRRDWREAQHEMRTLVPKLLRAVRADHRLGESCAIARLTDPLRDPMFVTGERGKSGYLLKRLRLTARIDDPAD